MLSLLAIARDGALVYTVRLFVEEKVKGWSSDVSRLAKVA